MKKLFILLFAATVFAGCSDFGAYNPEENTATRSEDEEIPPLIRLIVSVNDGYDFDNLLAGESYSLKAELWRQPNDSMTFFYTLSRKMTGGTGGTIGIIIWSRLSKDPVNMIIPSEGSYTLTVTSCDLNDSAAGLSIEIPITVSATTDMFASVTSTLESRITGYAEMYTNTLDFYSDAQKTATLTIAPRDYTIKAILIKKYTESATNKITYSEEDSLIINISQGDPLPIELPNTVSMFSSPLTDFNRYETFWEIGYTKQLILDPIPEFIGPTPPIQF